MFSSAVALKYCNKEDEVAGRVEGCMLGLRVAD